MVSLKKQYDKAKEKSMELMSAGLIKEYIAHLRYMEKLKKELLALHN